MGPAGLSSAFSKLAQSPSPIISAVCACIQSAPPAQTAIRTVTRVVTFTTTTTTTPPAKSTVTEDVGEVITTTGYHTYTNWRGPTTVTTTLSIVSTTACPTPSADPSTCGLTDYTCGQMINPYSSTTDVESIRCNEAYAGTIYAMRTVATFLDCAKQCQLEDRSCVYATHWCGVSENNCYLYGRAGSNGIDCSLLYNTPFANSMQKTQLGHCS